MVTPDSLNWRKSSYSANDPDACVEVAPVTSRIAGRDSKDHGVGYLIVSRVSWSAFVGLVKPMAGGTRASR